MKGWGFSCACFVASAVGPWHDPTYFTHWFDALAWGGAIYCGLRAVECIMTSAIREGDK